MQVKIDFLFLKHFNSKILKKVQKWRFPHVCALFLIHCMEIKV